MTISRRQLKPVRVSTTLPGGVFQAVVQIADLEGRSLSNALAALVEYAVFTRPSPQPLPASPPPLWPSPPS